MLSPHRKLAHQHVLGPLSCAGPSALRLPLQKGRRALLLYGSAVRTGHATTPLAFGLARGPVSAPKTAPSCNHTPCRTIRSVRTHAANDGVSTGKSLPTPWAALHEYIFGLPWNKLFPLAVIFSLATFNYTVLQMLKDSFVVIAGGAEALPFLMSLGVLPASIVFFLYYGKLVSKLPPWAVFYAAVAPLLGFYTLFATVLYPIADTLHPTEFLVRMQTLWPEGLHGLLKAVCNWTYSLFFCFAELWGSVVISVLFWTLANDVCTVAEAKTVYPLMGISANIALVLAGQWVKYVNVSWAAGNQHTSLLILVGTIVALSGAMMAAKAYVDGYIAVPADVHTGSKPRKKKKSKGSFRDSIEVIKGSKKVRNLAMLVIGYGVGHRLFEFAWKGQLRLACPSVTSYQNMLADVSTWTGALTIFFMLTSRYLFQRGWVVAACGTPLVLLVTGSLFFGASLAAQSQLNLGFSPAVLAGFGVYIGCLTQVFARSSKYSLFDPAKEMVYIEMDREEKTRGKAAVDLVGSQIGKSGASWLTQVALLVSGSLSHALPFLSACFVLVTILWVRATLSLNALMKASKAAVDDASPPGNAPQDQPQAGARVGLSGGVLRYTGPSASALAAAEANGYLDEVEEPGPQPVQSKGSGSSVNGNGSSAVAAAMDGSAPAEMNGAGGAELNGNGKHAAGTAALAPESVTQQARS